MILTRVFSHNSQIWIVIISITLSKFNDYVVFIGIISSYATLSYRTITNGGVDDKDINYSRLKKFSKCCQDQVSLWVPWNAWRRLKRVFQSLQILSPSFQISWCLWKSKQLFAEANLGKQKVSFFHPSFSLSGSLSLLSSLLYVF